MGLVRFLIFMLRCFCSFRIREQKLISKINLHSLFLEKGKKKRKNTKSLILEEKVGKYAIQICSNFRHKHKQRIKKCLLLEFLFSICFSAKRVNLVEKVKSRRTEKKIIVNFMRRYLISDGTVVR